MCAARGLRHLLSLFFGIILWVDHAPVDLRHLIADRRSTGRYPHRESRGVQMQSTREWMRETLCLTGRARVLAAVMKRREA